jgi:hypothetical protein
MASSTGATLGMCGSYNCNSSPQLSLIQSSIRFLKEGIESLDIIDSSFPLLIADFGSSHGSNSVYTIKLIIDLIKEIKKIERSFLIIHNDLPTNDWRSLFDTLNKDETYFGLGNGQSFYRSCLPSNCLTVGYSSASLHWLSRKPCNISNHCVHLYAEGEESALFKNQARDDYEQFLENRSREMISGGVLILNIVSVDDQGQSMLNGVYQLLYQCAKLVPFNEEELIDFTLPVYIRSSKECIDQHLFNKYSFKLINNDISCIDFKFYEQLKNGEITLDQFAQIQTGFMRCGTESILKQTLQLQRSQQDIQQLLDSFWEIYYEQVKLNPQQLQISSHQTYLILKKI